MEKKDKDIFKPYTWRKYWVRPHESIFSVLINFAKVNVMGIHQVLSLFSRISTSEKYDLRNAIFHDCVRNGLIIAEENLLPENYIYGFNDTLIDRHLFYSDFEQNIRICPKCISEFGYHSTLYQLKSLKTCPIHNVPLVTLSGYTYSTHTRIFNFKDINEFSVSDIPLPVDRSIDFDVNGIINYYNSYNINLNNSKYIGMFSRTNGILNFSKSLKDVTESDLVMVIGKKDIYDIRETLAEKYMCLYSSIYPDIITKVDNHELYLKELAKDYINGKLVEFIAYLFTLDLILQCNSDSFPGTYPDPKAIDSDIYSNDYIHKRIAFAEIIRGCKDQWICSDIIFKHPYTALTSHFTMYDNMNYKDLNEYVSMGLGNLSPSIITFMLTEALFDMYKYQWERFEEYIANKEIFSKTDICNRLPSIRYIVIETNNDKLLLYRQVEEKY